jgi:hypothetical protein
MIPAARVGDWADRRLLCLSAVIADRLSMVAAQYFFREGRADDAKAVDFCVQAVWRHLGGAGAGPLRRASRQLGVVAERIATTSSTSSAVAGAAVGGVSVLFDAFQAGTKPSPADVSRAADRVAQALDAATVPPPYGAPAWTDYELSLQDAQTEAVGNLDLTDEHAVSVVRLDAGMESLRYGTATVLLLGRSG